MSAEVTFGLLGPVAVRSGGVNVPLPEGKQQALLAVLLLRAGRVVAADDLAELLWAPASPPPSAAVSVRNYVKRLRQALGQTGQDRIVTLRGGYLIRVERSELDVWVMEDMLAAAHEAAGRAAWLLAAVHATAALDLWRGDPLAGLDLPLLTTAEVARLSELQLQARELRLEAYLHQGRHTAAVTELRQLAAASPLREHPHALLMVALHRCGRRAEALAVYLECRERLAEEIGAEPGPELQLVHRQVLNDDPALAPATADSPADQAVAAPADDKPHQLPPAASCFTGRNAELRALTDLVTAQPHDAAPALAISAIGGTAGVGKTALAIQWAHQVAGRFPDGQLYVNLRGYDPDEPVSATYALAGLLQTLGVSGKDIPEGEDDRARLYRSRLAGRRMLVVLDNARDSEQARPLLPGAPGCLVVVTSRDALAGLVARDGARRVLLDILPPGDAVALLRALIGERVVAEPDAAAKLAELCAYLPLALRVAAELADARPALSLAALIAELGGEDRLDALEAGGDQASAARAVFSWSCRNLPASAGRAFRLAALHPGGDFDSGAIAALTGTSRHAAARALAELARASLFHPAGSDRYGMHDLLRTYAAELAASQEPDRERRAAMSRLLDYYLQNARRASGILFPADAPASAGASSTDSGLCLSDEHTARAWLDAERANLTAIAAYAGQHGWPGHAVGLSEALFRFLDSRAFLADALLIHGAAARAAAQSGDRAAEAGAVINAGAVYLHLGRYRDAEQHFQRALTVSRTVGDRLGQLRSLFNLSLIYVRTAAYADATSSCRRALELSRGVGDRTREARALVILGQIASDQGHYQQAAEDLRQAADASRAAGDLSFLTVALIDLGKVEVLQGNYAPAKLHLQEAQTTARHVGYTMAEAGASAMLGFADLRQARHEQATRQLKHATEQLERSLTAYRGASFSTGEARVLCYLGESDLELGRPAKAAERYEQALAIYQRNAGRLGEAEARNGLGEAALARGTLGDARVHHQAALAIAIQIGSPGQQARAYEGLGNVSAAADDGAGARRCWQQALARYADMNVPEASRIRARLTPTASDHAASH